MTEQEVFNAAYIGLAKQGFKKCKNASGLCLLRHDGMKCAIGHCIPDQEYDAKLEMMSLFELHLRISTLIAADDNFLYELRSCHDDAGDPQTMRNNLADLAAQRGLIIPEVE